ncbi:hypothetical protein PBRA_001771 [Plasmodiophora brassicae]|uniref:Uncharacterized protein n=1 Tax=Plasmodiophora brassicae TaxID=37360 RepID=A0A0G4IZQ7_PLABS|nr:hypothetical protein PBRA_001771 [Plasmodiophora brassicae]
MRVRRVPMGLLLPVLMVCGQQDEAPRYEVVRGCRSQLVAIIPTSLMERYLDTSGKNVCVDVVPVLYSPIARTGRPTWQPVPHDSDTSSQHVKQVATRPAEVDVPDQSRNASSRATSRDVGDGAGQPRNPPAPSEPPVDGTLPERTSTPVTQQRSPPDSPQSDDAPSTSAFSAKHPLQTAAPEPQPRAGQTRPSFRQQHPAGFYAGGALAILFIVIAIVTLLIILRKRWVNSNTRTEYVSPGDLSLQLQCTARCAGNSA